MPGTNDSNLPPLRTIFDIDTSAFQEIETIFSNIDYIFPRLVISGFFFRDTMRETALYAREIADNLGGIALPRSVGGQSAFPIGGGTATFAFPDSYNEEEGRLESSNILREFFYGSNDPGFFNTFAGRALLYGSGGAGLGIAGQLLPGSFTRNELGNILDDLDIEIDGKALTRAILDGIDSAAVTEAIARGMYDLLQFAWQNIDWGAIAYQFLPTGTREFLGIVGDAIVPPAEGAEPPITYNQQAVDNIVEGVEDRLGNLGGGTLSKYLIGDGPIDLGQISSLQDIIAAFDETRIVKIIQAIDQLKADELIQVMELLTDSDNIGRSLAQVEDLEKTFEQLAVLLKDNVELRDLFEDLAEDAEDFGNKVREVVGEDEGFFDGLERRAGEAEERFEGLEGAADRVGLAFGNAFAQIAIEGQNAEQVLSQVLQTIANELIKLTIINPIAGAFSSGFSSLFGLSGAANAGGGMLRGARAISVNEVGTEYLVNANATARHRDTLDAINSGTYAEKGITFNIPMTFEGGVTDGKMAEYAQVIEGRVMSGVQKAIETYGTPLRDATQEAARSK